MEVATAGAIVEAVVVLFSNVSDAVFVVVDSPCRFLSTWLDILLSVELSWTTNIFSTPTGHCGQHCPCIFTGLLQVVGIHKLPTHSRSPFSQ